MKFGQLEPLAGDELSFFAGRLSSAGEPLERSIRTFMETRFAVDLRNVRIHTGAHAVEAARRLNARAFARGNDIYFAAGEYTPDKPEGLWLLTHELTHVIQQSRCCVTACDGAPRLGGLHDSFEIEANLVADRMLKSEPLPPITPDGSGAIRRALSLVTSSAQITLDRRFATAEATATSDGSRMVCNMTKEFNRDDPLKSGDAFDVSGAVNVIADHMNDIFEVGPGGRLNFGFVQIARVFFEGQFWAGRKRTEGSVSLVITNAPAWPQDRLVSLDTDLAEFPFASRPTEPIMNFVQKDGKFLVQITNIKMGDHPVFGGPLIMKNQKTVTNNFLFNLKQHVEYFSVLVAQDHALENKGKPVTPLAHFRWVTDYNARFNWRAGTPVVQSRGMVDFDEPVQGAPTDPEIVRVLARVSDDPIGAPPFTNDTAEDATKKSVNGESPSNFSHNDRWFVNVPRDFWG